MSTSSYSASPRTYVDNSANRSLGRVGMPHGSCVQSSNSTSNFASQGTYVDNATNRSLGRVGMPHGSCVQSSSSTSNSASPRTYVDNSYNRKHDRVGMPHGSCVQSSSSTSNSASQRTYVDNSFNRKHGRVGKPIGTHVISKDGSITIDTNKKYKDNPRNQRLDRVGKPIMRKIRKMKEDNITDTESLDDIKDRLRNLNFYDPVYPAYFNAQHSLQRGEVEEMWQKRGIVPSTDPILAAESIKEIIPLCEIQVEWDKKIGEGGFSKVFPGLWKKSIPLVGEKETPIAFKQFIHQRITPKRKDQLEKEIKIFKALDHPNVVKLFGMVVEKDHLGIVMEYLPKTLFHAIFDEETKFTGHDKMRIVREVVCAIEYLHIPIDSPNPKPLIAHGDIKSQNILLDSKNIAKLCDFGLSTMKNAAQSSSTHSSAVPGQGTPRYAAPEVLRGELLNMPQLLMSDIYSLSLVVYEILVEEEPFEDLSYLQLVEHVGRKSLRPPLEETEVTEPIKQVIMRGWNKTAKDRPDIRKLSEDLSQIDKWFV